MPASLPVHVVKSDDSPLQGVLELAAGENHTCGVRNVDRSLFCWGDGSRGQLGTDAQTDALSATETVAAGDVALVAAGESHTCTVVADGSVHCWGGNAYGQLGDATTTSRLHPVATVAP